MNIVQILDEYALCQSDHIALKDHAAGVDRALTYRHLQQRTEETAERLLKSGVKVGDRILLLVPLSIETYVLLLAIFRIGAVAVIADSSFGLKALKSSIAAVKPDAMISSRGIKLIASALDEVRKIKSKLDVNCLVSPIGIPTIFGKQNTDNPRNGAANILDVEAAHPALITFTSGSTGTPKVIVRSHGFLLNQQKVIAGSLACRKNDIELTTLPVFVLSALAQGITSVLPDCDMRKPASINASCIIAQINKCNVNRIIAGPAFLQKLSDHLLEVKQKLPGVQNVFSGGGPVFPSLLKALETVFPRAELTAVYGSTEAEPIAHISSRLLSKAVLEKAFAGGGLPAGKPIQEIELAIIDPAQLDACQKVAAGEDCEKLPTFKAGEILVTGEHVVKTYLNGLGNAETKITLKGSGPSEQLKVWHRTGDAGYLDDEGNLWLLGRSASRISDRWGEVYPFQVEVAASEIPSLKRATCLKSDGKRILVVEKKRLTLAHFLSGIFQHVKPYSCTIGDAFSWLHFDEVRMVQSIPVDVRHNSKIQYAMLAERLKH